MHHRGSYYDGEDDTDNPVQNEWQCRYYAPFFWLCPFEHWRGEENLVASSAMATFTKDTMIPP